MRLPPITPLQCLEWFVVGNLAFLGVDIFIAHSENAFRVPTEWVPIAFSSIAPLLALPGALHVGPRRVTRALDLVVGASAVAVGVLGMVLHLTSAFFLEQTLRSLVYSAPFIAPLSYVGVGLLLLLARLEPATSTELGAWVLLLALGGFAGNFGLSLLDHAQNDFYNPVEWVSVVAAAFGCSFYLVALLGRDPRMLRWCFGVCLFESVVGVVGFALHLLGDTHRPARSIVERFVFGAPAFAPLLFTNLALLAAVGLWAMLRGDRPSARAC
jgi:hypothetical protein